MKLPGIFKFKSSIANRMTWRVVGTIFLIFLLISAFIFFIVWIIGAVALSGVYFTTLNLAQEKINNVFTNVEVALANHMAEVEEDINSGGKDFYVIKRLLNLNPDIAGGAVALNPSCEPMKGERFAPYVYRDSTGFKSKNLNTPEYDYQHQDWYKMAVDSARSFWSDPSKDKFGGDVLMTTFSVPLMNSKGKVYAVQAADISVDWIEKQVEQVDSLVNVDFHLGMFNDKNKESVYSFIITKEGKFVAHPDKEILYKGTIGEFLKKMTGKEQEGMVNSLVSGKKGILTLNSVEDNSYFIYYAPIKRTGWSMGILVPVKENFGIINTIVKILAFIMLFGILIVGWICRSTIYRITKPLTHFADSADEIARGNFQAKLPVIKTKDEMMRLRNSFATMQESLINQMEETKTVNEERGRMEGELRIARDIQMSMLPMTFPAFPDRTDVNIYAHLTPAREVGGDLFDYHIRDEKLFFCVGDVSGKGVPAAIVMAVTRALFRTATAHQSIPGKIIGGINDMMSEENESDMFVTLFVGVLDLPTGRLRYSNAGHNPPVRKANGHAWVLPCDANLPVGVVKGWKYSTQELTITPQTTLFIYTDGLTEAENVEHEQFQEHRMYSVILKSDQQPETLIKNMTESIEHFVGEAEQSDDLTMLAIQYTKQEKEVPKDLGSITLTNDVEQIPLLAAFVEEVCETLQLDMSTTMNINLALEEAVVNVMDYAYPQGMQGNVTIEAKAKKKQLKFIIYDWGKPFDPTTKSEIDTSLPAEERAIGGLGIHLLRQIMDSINYERTNGMNVLTLRKKLD